MFAIYNVADWHMCITDSGSIVPEDPFPQSDVSDRAVSNLKMDAMNMAIETVMTRLHAKRVSSLFT